MVRAARAVWWGARVEEHERAAVPAAAEVGGERGLQRGELPRLLARDDDRDVDLVEEVVHGAGRA